MSHRTAIELYRDLLRLVAHVAPGLSPKSIALRSMIRTEFDKSRDLSPNNPSDQEKIEALKANAVRALSNYMLIQGGIQDKNKGGKLGAAMDSYHERNIDSITESNDNKEGGDGSIT